MYLWVEHFMRDGDCTTQSIHEPKLTLINTSTNCALTPHQTNGSLSKVIFEHFTSQEISHIEDLDLLGWEFEQEYWFALMNISHSDSSNFCKIHQFDRGVINFFHSPKKLPILHISYYLLFWPMSDTWMTMKHVNFIEYKQLTSVWLIYTLISVER